MKILFIHNDYAKPSGEEHASAAIAELLAAHGHDIVWYRRSSSEISGSLVGRIKAFFTALHNPAACRAVAALTKRERPAVAFVQNLYPLISPSVLGVLHRLGVPVVMRCPNYRLFCPNGLLFSHGHVCEKCRDAGREWWCLLRNCEASIPKSMAYALRNAVARLGRRFAKHVTEYLVLSEFQRAYFRAGGISGDRLSLVPNMITKRSGAEAPAGGGTVIGFLGRIASEKGFDDFIAAARRLPHLTFAAAGSVKAGYERELEGLPENLELRGFLSGPDLESFVDDMQMLVTCSKWFEGFPNTIARTMAAGRPVVATAIGAISEIVDDGETGLLYAPGDADGLVEHVSRLAEDSELRRCMGEAGRAKAERLYSSDAVYAALDAAFKKAIAKGVV